MLDEVNLAEPRVVQSLERLVGLFALADTGVVSVLQVLEHCFGRLSNGHMPLYNSPSLWRLNFNYDC